MELEKDHTKKHKKTKFTQLKLFTQEKSKIERTHLTPIELPSDSLRKQNKQNVIDSLQ